MPGVGSLQNPPLIRRDCLLGKSVLVTGHNGFLGSWLSAALGTAGAQVHGWHHVREPVPPVWSFLGTHEPSVSPVDITDGAAVVSALRSVSPDLVVHLAGLSSVGTCLKEPLRAFQTNAVGTLHIFEAIRALGLPTKVVIASSDAVFGNLEPAMLPERGMDEAQAPTFGEPYGTSKAAAELVASCYQTTYFGDRPTVAIVRFANVFGYGDPDEGRVIPQFVLGALSEGVVRLKYRLNGRQFIYVTDLVAGLLAVCRWLLTADSAEGDPVAMGSEPVHKPPVFHLASTEYPNTKEPFVRMKDLAELVCTTVGGRVDETGCIEYAPKEHRIQALSCAWTTENLGWRPSVALPEGISLLAGWYRALRTPDRCPGGLDRLFTDAMGQIAQASAKMLNARRAWGQTNQGGEVTARLGWYVRGATACIANYVPKLVRTRLPYLEAFVDNRAFPPFEVEIQVSSSCNLGCEWCIGDQVQKQRGAARLPDRLDEERVNKIIDEIISLRENGLDIQLVKFSGFSGEPLSDRHRRTTIHGIERLLDAKREVGLFTNGVFMTDETWPTLARIYYVNVSLDAGRPSTFLSLKKTNGEAFYRVLANVAGLRKVRGDKEGTGNNITVSYVIVPENHDEIFETTQRVKDAGADTIRFKCDILGEYRLGGDVLKGAFDQLDRAKRELEGPEFRVTIIHSKTDVLDETYRAWKRRDGCFYQLFLATIGSDGKVYLCDHNTMHGAKILGDAVERSFQDIWRGKKRERALKTTPIPCKCDVCPPFGNAANLFLREVRELADKHGPETVKKALRQLKEELDRREGGAQPEATVLSCGEHQKILHNLLRTNHL